MTGKTQDFTENPGLSPHLIANAFGQALESAYQFVGSSVPNPPVGCTILDAQGNRLAVCAHQKAGQKHAEALAIEQCQKNGTMERIHTMLVTLEPCNHYGRTPACTKAILTTPAREIWIGARDPNPNVFGNGAKTLADGGLRVKFIANLDDDDADALAFSAKRLIAPFAKHVRTAMPWVTIKQAINRAGGMIPEPGQKTFTSPSSLIYAHRLRKRADAILTGSGTILADNPRFDVRHVADFAEKRRFLVIMDRTKRVGEPYLQAAAELGFDVWVESEIEVALKKLGQAGAHEVLVEAGPSLVASILPTDLWDEHITIEQGPGLADKDVVSTRYASFMDRQFQAKGEPDVLGNY
ncbi:Diaminohydroxyphosphoribosylaminopyrimidine deaminase / 5-amino-6-(5-phosphoribosylamino)uracil reductase [hydrothermal vent metagenome]|uniref:Diaminohydroxyphosphoribosylaminopyrimidine deaminase / 5-amino-6-(5-phosphoribosylamino)uracil reductase n=1 Tax=hydrothermal vent metagenome TaxID=652676 RepID=A0A3B0TYF2_9ZZZZ